MPFGHETCRRAQVEPLRAEWLGVERTFPSTIARSRALGARATPPRVAPLHESRRMATKTKMARRDPCALAQTRHSLRPCIGWVAEWSNAHAWKACWV